MNICDECMNTCDECMNTCDEREYFRLDDLDGEDKDSPDSLKYIVFRFICTFIFVYVYIIYMYLYCMLRQSTFQKSQN